MNNVLRACKGVSEDKLKLFERKEKYPIEETEAGKKYKYIDEDKATLGQIKKYFTEKISYCNKFKDSPWIWKDYGIDEFPPF